MAQVGRILAIRLAIKVARHVTLVEVRVVWSIRTYKETRQASIARKMAGHEFCLASLAASMWWDSVE